jgi:hypothetical protein
MIMFLIHSAEFYFHLLRATVAVALPQHVSRVVHERGEMCVAMYSTHIFYDFSARHYCQMHYVSEILCASWMYIKLFNCSTSWTKRWRTKERKRKKRVFFSLCTREFSFTCPTKHSLWNASEIERKEANLRQCKEIDR